MTPDNMDKIRNLLNEALVVWEDGDDKLVKMFIKDAIAELDRAPLPLSMTEDEMEEESHKWANAEPPWEGPVERTYARTVFKDGLRYASTHTKTITVDEIMEVVSDCTDTMDGDGSCSVVTVLDESKLRDRLTAKFK